MTDEPLPPPIESARTTFLQRGASIIASERGLTPRARLLLESLAKDLALSSDDFEQAMVILQSGETLAAKSVDPQRARFREVLKRQLAELPAKIISARHEQTLASFAVTKLLMAEDAARDDILQVSGELGMRRVTFEEALRYVEDVIAQKLTDDTTIDPVVQARFVSLGRDWGLEPADVTELVRFRLEENAARRRREKMWNVGVIGGAAGAIVLVLIVLLVMASRSWLGSSAEVVSPTETASEQASPRRTRLPSWWDTDLTIAITHARNEQESFAPVYDAISSPDPQRRSQGYELLIERAAAQPFDYRVWKPLEPILLGCYALEPDDAAAATLRQKWLGVPERAIEQIPASSDGYQAAIRPLNAAVQGMKEERTPASRSRSLADDIGRLLRTSLDVQSPESDLQRDTLSALAVVLLEQLAEGIEKRPDLLTRHYPTLAALARDRVPPAELARLDALIAANAIQHTPDTWRSWESILNRGVEARDALSVLRIIDAFERCKNDELRKTLASRLFARLGISPAGIATDQYAPAMRKALGAVLPAEAGDSLRWARLEQHAEIALQQARTAKSDDADLLRAGVDLAWQVNLAMSLAIERANPGLFDRWLEEGLPSERKADEISDETSLVTPVPAERLPRDVQDTLDRYLHELGDWQKLDEPRRLSYLHGIAQIAPRVRDISPLQARQVAGYLLGRKGDQEQSQLIDSASALRGWKQLRIALADGMERAAISPDQLGRLVLVFTGRDVESIETNRSQARRILLQSALIELQSADSARARDESARDIDRYAEWLAQTYRERAQLLGSPPNERETATNASAILRLSLQRLGSSEATSGLLDQATRLAALSNVVAESDPQKAVILQRALVERTLDDIARRQPEQLAAAKQIVDGYRQENRAADNVLVQLRNGESTLLRLWLLYQPRERR